MPADVRLSAHFYLSQFTAWPDAAQAGQRNVPLGQQEENLRRLAQLLELVRGALNGAEINILRAFRRGALTPGGRNPAAEGRCVDFIAPAFGTPREICAHLVAMRLVSERLLCAPTWVSIEIAPFGQTEPRRQVQTGVFEHGVPMRILEGLL